jgi:hypothetical protein
LHFDLNRYKHLFSSKKLQNGKKKDRMLGMLLIRLSGKLIK